MKNRKITLTLLLFAFFQATICIQVPYQAVVISPITDLIGSPIQNFAPNRPIEQAYQELSLCGGFTNPYVSCPRMHQLLAHEIVKVVEERGEEVYVQTSNAFFITKISSKPRDSYWMLKKSIIPIKSLGENAIEKLPPPVSYKKEKIPNEKIVTLTQPYQSFSAGTRFKLAGKLGKKISVFALPPGSSRIKKIKLPREQCVIGEKEKRTLFLKTVRQWAHCEKGYIPYVWGGCSFIVPATGNWHEKKMEKRSHFCIEDDASSPKNGFDCAGLITRAAHIAGIPFFYKNTTTIAQHLKPITPDSPLQAGDVIWIPWHVMIVGDLEKNTLIEARSYRHGYGKVQEIELKKVFKNIETYHDLQQALLGKKPLQRMDKNGKIRETFKNFKLLQLFAVENKKKQEHHPSCIQAVQEA